MTRRVLLPLLCGAALSLWLVVLSGFDFGAYFSGPAHDPNFLPLWTPDPLTRPDPVLSWRHWRDVAMLLAWVAPGPVVVILWRGLTRLRCRRWPNGSNYNGQAGSPAEAQPAMAFFLILTLSHLFFVCFASSPPGMWRDWDLFSPVGIPLAVLAAWLWRER